MKLPLKLYKNKYVTKMTKGLGIAEETNLL